MVSLREHVVSQPNRKTDIRVKRAGTCVRLHTSSLSSYLYIHIILIVYISANFVSQVQSYA
jgi:hypothetical protein